MKKSKSPTLEQLQEGMEAEKRQALWWEKQGQYNTLHHDRIKVYERQIAELEKSQEKSGRIESKPEEVNDGSSK